MLAGVVGLHRLLDGQAQGLGDDPPARHVVPVHEGDRRAGVAGASGAPDAVDVDLLVLGALVVDDVGDVVDVDAAGGHVGGHQDVHLVVAEGAQGLLAGPLAEVAVQGPGGETAGAQVVGHPGRRALGAREDDGASAPLGLEDPGDDLHLVHRVGAVDDLLDRLDGHALIARVLGADVGGAGHVAARQGDHGPGHGGAEEHRVPVGAGAGQDLLHVGKEAQVQHLVGLVQDDGGDVSQVQHAALHEVDETAGRAHDDLGSPLEVLDLGLVGAPAVDLDDAHGALGGSRGQLLGDLLGQLTGGQDDQGLGAAGGGILVPALLPGAQGVHEQGDAEAQGLAGAGLGLTDDVLPLQGHRQGEGLDGEGVGDALGGQGLADLRLDAEVGEGLAAQVGLGALVGDVGSGLVQDGGVGAGRLDDPGRGGRGAGSGVGTLDGGLVVCGVVVGLDGVGPVLLVAHEVPCLLIGLNRSGAAVARAHSRVRCVGVGAVGSGSRSRVISESI